MRLGVAIVPLFCLGCAGQNGPSRGAAAPTGATDAVLTPVDTAYDPCADFADYACGTDKQPLGLLQKNAGIMIVDRPRAVRRFLDRLVSGEYRDGKRSTGLLRDFYVRCTDVKARDLGLRSLHAQLEAVSRIETVPDLAHALGVLHRSGTVQALIRLDADWEMNAPNERYVAGVEIGDPTSVGDSLEKHRKHWQALVKLVGGISSSEIDGAARVDSWLATSTIKDHSDREAEERPLTPSSVLEKAHFPWRRFFGGLGLPPTTPIRAAGPDELARIDALIRLPLTDLKSSVKVAILERSAEFIGLSAFEEEMRFHYGIAEEHQGGASDLPQTCTDLMLRSLRPWLDEAFLATLPVPAERPAQELFQMLRDRFARSVASASWLDDVTRKGAVEKVSRIALRMHTDPIQGLDEVVLEPGSLLDADLQLRARFAAQAVGEIGSPVQRKLHIETDPWGMYSSLVNSVWLSPEFARYPWVQTQPFNAINFGALGTFLGHEIAHALTITGRPFDGNGVKRETWSPAAVAAFESRGSCLEKELRTFDAGAKWRVDAHRTLDEDMAELVGLQLALITMDENAGSSSTLAREMRHREFFLAYAQQWCGESENRDDDDPVDEDHSPLARALSGILANVPEFAETFHCTPGKSRMAPQQRCAIW